MSRRDASLRRKPGNKPPYPLILIYCEGARTEKTYFDDIRAELRTSTVRMRLGNQHGEPLGLVTAAIKQQRQERSRSGSKAEAYDQVWCVFDVEVPGPHEHLAEACRLAERHGIRCAISNPCFELWLALHFREPPGPVTNDNIQRLLERYDSGYTRRDRVVRYDVLRDRQPDALARAIRLDRRYHDTDPIPERNPWTSVHELVSILFDDAHHPPGAGLTGRRTSAPSR